MRLGEGLETLGMFEHRRVFPGNFFSAGCHHGRDFIVSSRRTGYVYKRQFGVEDTWPVHVCALKEVRRLKLSPRGEERQLRITQSLDNFFVRRGVGIRG